MITSIYEYKQIYEKYVNLWTKESMANYIEEVYDILVKAYEDLDGGFLTADSPEKLIEKCDLIKINKRGGKISAVSCYKVTKFGRKIICGGTDGTDRGKADLFSIIKEDITEKHRNTYSEVSGALEHIMKKYGGMPIPNYLVSEIIGKEITPDPNGFHYTRKIGNKNIRKVLVGNVNNVDNN